MQSQANAAREPGGAGTGSSSFLCSPAYAIMTAATAVVSHGILNHPARWTGTGKLALFFFLFFFLTSNICRKSDIGTDSPSLPLVLPMPPCGAGAPLTLPVSLSGYQGCLLNHLKNY